MGGGRSTFAGVFAALLAVVAAVNAAAGEAPATSIVVGMAKCADCSRKDMNTEAAFKGLQVAIKCKNNSGEYESKAVGDLDGSGAFTVSLAADLHGADCFAQLHSAASTPCPGQEPSKIVPLAAAEEGGGESTFVAVAGKAHYPSAECASAIMCYPCGKKPLFGHFPKQKPDFMHHHKKPMPEYQPPTPEYGQPAPECPPPTPEYGQPAPECPPTSPAYGQPDPECPPTPPAYGQPQPECPPATPECPPTTPAYGQPAPECPPGAPAYGQPAPECPPATPACPPPAPVYGQPAPDCPPAAPAYPPPTPECPPPSQEGTSNAAESTPSVH